MQNQKAVFFVAEDFGFISHRIPMAKAVSSCGFDIVVVARENPNKSAVKAIIDLGFKFIPISIKRGSINFFNEIRTLKEFYSIIKKERPNLLFNVAFKPIIYGSICAYMYKTSRIINLITGMGSIFTDYKSIKIKLIRSIIEFFLRIVLRLDNQFLIVQNSDDLLKLKNYVKKDRIKKIQGSGVNTDIFIPLPEPEGQPFTATFVGRMIKDKGVYEFIEAAKVLKTWGKNITMLLVGDPDPENLSSIPLNILQDLDQQGIIEWIPHTNDIVGIWKRSHLAVLPSYSEGGPKSLIEAAACQRAIITTNINGCKELVKHEITGILVPQKDHLALAQEISRLADNPCLRHKLALAVCKYVRENYSSKVVQQKIVELVEGKWS